MKTSALNLPVCLWTLCVLVVPIFGESPQEFKSLPTTIKAPENDTVLLPCYLDATTGDGAHFNRVRWYRDGTILTDIGPPSLLPPDRYKLWGNGSLQVDNVQPMDTAEYMCEVVRPEPWSTVRQFHAIEVLHHPYVQPDPESGFLEVKLAEEVKMSCKTGGVPKPIVTWKHNGEDMRLIDNRETLKFTASDRQLAGIYECWAVNGVGEPAKAQIELNIIYPPELIASRSWIHSAPGLRAQLECKVSADPPAAVTWLKGETVVPLDNRVISLADGDKHSLLIRNVHRSDFGIYTCRALNDLGQGDMQIQLSGVPNPGVFKKTDEKNADSKSSYALIWEVDSYTPIIEYSLWFRPYKATRRSVNKPEWTKLTIPTEHSSNTGPMYSKAYTIKGLKEKTVYEALLVSRNRYGWSKPSPILRFATAGADLKEEMLTTMQMESQENIIPLEMTSPASPSVHPPAIASLFAAFSALFIVVNRRL